MRVAPKIVLSPEEEKGLRKLSGGRSCSVRLAQRAKIVLLAAKGLENCRIAAELGIDRGTVSRWRRRYLEAGLKGIEKDAHRPGRLPSISPAKVSEVIRKTTQTTPENATEWSRRTMAAEVGISAASVGRIWKKNGLKPHLARTFKVSNDPRFSEKLEDIIDLYVNPPEDALVLSVDEKSQIQALDRTQPGLPLNPSFAWDLGQNGPKYLESRGETALESAWPDLTSGEVCRRGSESPESQPRRAGSV